MFKKLTKLVLVMVALSSFCLGKAVLASENKLNFTPTIKQTPQKMDDSQTDFKLKGEAGESVEVAVEVKNESNRTISLKTKMKDAATNNQGVVNYTSDQSVLNKELSLAKLANYSESFELKGKEKKEIKFSIPLPEKNFSGIVLGGLLIEQEPDKEAKGMIKNVFSYSIPVVVVESEENIEADLAFNSVKPELTGGRNALKISLDNPINNLLPEAKFQVSVTKKDGKETLYRDEIKEVNFAPNNTFHHYVDMGKDAYKAGEYTAHIKVNSPYGDWKWNEDFEIKGDVAKKLNKESISVQRMSRTMKIMIGIVILLLLLVLIIFYIMRKKLKEAQNKSVNE